MKRLIFIIILTTSCVNTQVVKENEQFDSYLELIKSVLADKLELK